MNTNKVVQKKLLVVGQPVLDHVVDVDIIHQTGTLMKVMDIDVGQIVFKKGSYISTEYGAGKRLVFGPFLDYEEDVASLGKKAIGRRFRKGQKVDIPPEKVQILGWREDVRKFGEGNVGRLGYVVRSPGGGGTNCCYIIHQVFKKLPLGFSGIYSVETDELIEDSLSTILDGEADIKRVNKIMPVNIVLEGIMNDRIILKSPQQTDVTVEGLSSDAHFMLVNTLYNVYFACAALRKAMEMPSAVIACTKSLLNEAPIPPEVRGGLKPYGVSDDIDSVFSFFKNVILPGSPHLIYIFNEDEFQHLLKYRSAGDDRVYVVNGEGRALFDQLILGMKLFRQFQAPHKTNLIVTVGRLGAFWLDTDDDLHHCAILTSDETGKIEGQRNAIGDLFAGVLTALIYGYEGAYTIEIFNSSGQVIKESLVPPILIDASAAADAGVFDGFYKVRYASVNSNIHLKTQHYRYLGNLNEIRIAKDLESLEDVMRPGGRFPDITKGQIKGATVLEQIVPRSLLR